MRLHFSWPPPRRRQQIAGRQFGSREHALQPGQPRRCRCRLARGHSGCVRQSRGFSPRLAKTDGNAMQDLKGRMISRWARKTLRRGSEFSPAVGLSDGVGPAPGPERLRIGGHGHGFHRILGRVSGFRAFRLPPFSVRPLQIRPLQKSKCQHYSGSTYCLDCYSWPWRSRWHRPLLLFTATLSSSG